MASVLTTGADVGSGGVCTVTVSLNGSTNPLVHIGLMANEDFFVGGLSGTEEVSIDGVDVSANEIGSALEPNHGMQRDYWLGAANLPTSGNVDCVADIDNGGTQPAVCALVIDNAADQAPTENAGFTHNNASSYDNQIDVTPSNADSALIVTTLLRDPGDETHSVDGTGALDSAGAESWANFWQNGGCGYGDDVPASALQVDGDWTTSGQMAARACVYEQGSAGTVHNLTSTDVESASEVDTPTIGQEHALSASDVSSASEVDTPALNQTHALSSTDVESASEVDNPTLGQAHPLTATDVSSVSEVDTPTIGQTHAITASDISSASEVDNPTLGQEHALTASDISSASEVDNPVLAEGNHDLTSTDVESASEVDAPTIGQTHALTGSDIEAASEVDSPSIDGSGWDLTRIDPGWYDSAMWFNDPEFREIIKEAADNGEAWADWVPGVESSLDSLGVLPKGSDNVKLDLDLIMQEADGNAGWARWEPNSPRHPGNLQLNIREALDNNFSLT